MRTCLALLLGCLVLVGAVTGCAPKELSSAELEAAAVGTWRRNPAAPPLQLNADKTLVAQTDFQDRGGTWSFNPEKREITLNVDQSEPINGQSWSAATWTAYISKDGTALNFYSMEASMIESVKGNLGKDPGTILRKD
ncbi:MAG TPA: hypothetical protein VGN57_07560 [Pirellulaceae bacterium]|jgi:hypothetical protein|nr:hypothetical protein [Pirellulaceae bacterium]